MSEVAEGVSYPSSEAGPIDQWSERIYRALHPWQIARDGEWTRWDPGYVLLTVKKVAGEEIDPMYLYTADEELTVSFGYWETHNPAPYEQWGAEPEIIAEHAKALIEQWFRGEVRTAVLTDADGKWCGSVTIEPRDLEPQLEEAARWVRHSRPARIQVRTPYPADWQSFDVKPDWLSPA